MSNRRRWLMPIVILLIACVFYVWSNQRATQAVVDVEQFVTSVIADGPPAGAIVPPGLDEHLSALAGSTPPQVAVTTGDLEAADGTATHTAIISTDGTPRLGLRLVHVEGEPPAISIVGYWIP